MFVGIRVQILHILHRIIIIIIVVELLTRTFWGRLNVSSFAFIKKSVRMYKLL